MKNIYILLCVLIFVSCGKEFEPGPIGDKGNSIPDPVSNVRVLRNIPGGAVIAYDLSDNLDIQYVKAEFMSTTGKLREVKSSSYVDTLVIKGLGSTDPKTVKLYSVSRKEQVSTPVEVTINPLMPPLLNIRNSLEYSVDFGGFLLMYEGNETREEVSLYALMKDSDTGEMVEHQILYPSQEKDTLSVRGLKDVETEFGVYVRDRWDNISDTLFFTLTPWREDYLDKKQIKYISVAGDVTWNNYTGGASHHAYDDIIGNGNYIHTPYPVEFPHRYTLDLGVTVQLSRFLLWQRPGGDVLYQHGAPKHYKVYGRADDPGAGNAGDPLAGWTLLTECYSFKPSKLPLGQNSAEDEAYAAAGEEYSFPRDIPEIRYIRFEMLESWSGMKCSVVSELSFYGEIKD